MSLSVFLGLSMCVSVIVNVSVRIKICLVKIGKAYNTSQQHGY